MSGFAIHGVGHEQPSATQSTQIHAVSIFVWIFSDGTDCDVDSAHVLTVRSTEAAGRDLLNILQAMHTARALT
ncbi:hypothetical protein BRW65_17975 [Mycobacterium paraffinicum]|uniref:Uncharacterized protein n=1 Tax=Mycobacterium paraffinicum TaxID=53378 RepID=A0A1Q4HS61_9MYCO|nr:hypothetical protein BRW65_17975 [Mycobacterium paraffinicum]